MNDVCNVYGPLEAVDGDRIETLGVVDLGDAVEETKQAAQVPLVVDNYMQLGWNG
jgi:hypothetical protein